MLKNSKTDTKQLYDPITIEQLERLLQEEEAESMFDFGYVEDGIYKIGDNLYTGRKGYEDFLNGIKEELNNLK